MPKLVLPSKKYKKSFLKDFLYLQKKPSLEHASWGIYSNKKIISKDFAGFVSFINSQSKGLNLLKGYVPHTIFWLVEDEKFLGTLSIRHKLTPHLKKIGGHIGYEIAKKFQGRGYGKLILKLGLKKARNLGIKKALLTCDVTNVRSKKVIEGNGGKAITPVNQGKGTPKKLRYWLKT